MGLSVRGESKLLARHSIVYGLGNMLSKVVGFLMLPIYTRFLSPKDYGTLELLTLTSEVIAIIISGRISSGIARFYFQYDDDGDRAAVITTSIIGVAVLSGVGIIVACYFRNRISSLVLHDSSLGYFFLIAFVGLWISLVSEIGFLYLRIIKSSGRFIGWSLAKLVLALSMNIYFVVVVKSGVIGILYSRVIAGSFIIVTLVLPLLYRMDIRISKAKLLELLRFSIPLVPASLANMVVLVSDRFFLGSIVSLGEVGIYSLANRFAVIPGYFISAPFMQIWTVRRLEVYKEPNSEEVMGTVFTYFCLLMVAVGLSVAIFAKDAIQIMAAKEFWNAWRLVPILVIAQVVLSFFQHFNMGILISKKTKYFLIIDSVNACIALFLYYMLIPRYGALGTAIGSLVAYTFRVLLVYIITIRFYRIHVEIVRILKIFTTGALVYLGCMWISSPSIWGMVGPKLLILSCFPLLLLTLGFFNQAELGFIKNIVKKRLCNDNR